MSDAVGELIRREVGRGDVGVGAGVGVAVASDGGGSRYVSGGGGGGDVGVGSVGVPRSLIDASAVDVDPAGLAALTVPDFDALVRDRLDRNQRLVSLSPLVDDAADPDPIHDIA